LYSVTHDRLDFFLRQRPSRFPLEPACFEGYDDLGAKSACSPSSLAHHRPSRSRFLVSRHLLRLFFETSVLTSADPDATATSGPAPTCVFSKSACLPSGARRSAHAPPWSARHVCTATGSHRLNLSKEKKSNPSLQHHRASSSSADLFFLCPPNRTPRAPRVATTHDGEDEAADRSRSSLQPCQRRGGGRFSRSSSSATAGQSATLPIALPIIPLDPPASGFLAFLFSLGYSADAFAALGLCSSV
jgi:hypothetical protein